MAEETEYDLVVEDTNLEEFNTEIDSLVTEIEDIISTYLKVMHQVLDSGLKEGKEHNNLDSLNNIERFRNYKNVDADKCNDRFDYLKKFYDIEVNRLKGDKNLSSIAILE